MACVPCWLSLRSGCRNVMSLKSLLSMGGWSIRYFKGCLVLISSQLRQGSASFLSNFDLGKGEFNFWFGNTLLSAAAFPVCL